MLSVKKLVAVSAAGVCMTPALAGAQEVAMADAAATADEVVVTASLTEQSSAVTPAFTTVITADDILKSPVNSLADLLRETVGVNNQSDGNGRDEIQIRGLDGHYTLILVNGKRISSSGAAWRGGDFDFSSIPLGAIERVEIVRGPMAALYGSDAIGGVVNIITKQPTKDWHGAVTGEYRVVGSGADGDQRRVNGSLSGALAERLSLSLNAEVLNRDHWYRYSDDDPTEVPALEGKRSTNATSTLRYRIGDAQDLDVDLEYNRDKRPYDLSSYVYYPAYDYESFTYAAEEMRRWSYGLTHTGRWDWGKTVAYVKQEDGKIDDYNSDYDDPQQRTVREKNTYAKAYAGGNLGINALIGGVDFRRQQIGDAATYTETGEAKTDNIALFAQDELSLTGKLRFTLGGRYDHDENFGGHFSPKGYLTYEVLDGITLKGGAGRAFKAPDAYQLSEQYSVISCGGSCYLSGNPDLKPETSTSYESGVEVRRQRWRLSFALYDNDVKDMIIAVYDASVPSREWQNIAKARTRGVELDGRVDVVETLAVSGNFTYMDGDYRDADGTETKLDYRPEVMTNLTVDWQATRRLTATAAGHYVGRQWYEGVRISPYTRVDLGAAFRLGEALSLRAGVKNLTDVNLDEKADGTIYTHELGRNYYVSATYSF
ncbi:MAG: TonB-dependent receptor [Solimonas sp.]